MAHPSQTPLEKALSFAPPPSLGLLSFCHVTLKKHLSGIVRAHRLEPAYCDVLGTKSLFFSYGAAYYRPPNHCTESSTELPVAFVFSSKLLSKIERFFPFDTGGIARQIFGDTWTRAFSPLGDFAARDSRAPERMVSCLYGSNDKYLRGQVRAKPAISTSPIPLVHKFLKRDLSALNVDQRQRTIECVSTSPFGLVDTLTFVMLPDIAAPHLKRLWQRCTHKFAWETYPADVNENPAAVLTHVNKRLRERFSYEIKPPY